MTRRAKRAAAAIASPVILGMLKLHTHLTGKERARVIIINEQQEVLLVHEIASNRWSLPGGGIEKDETPIEAVAREIEEETGVKVDSSTLELLGILRKPETDIGYVAHIFMVTIQKDEFGELGFNKRELIDAGWFELDHLPTGMSGVTRAAFALLSKTRPV